MGGPHEKIRRHSKVNKELTESLRAEVDRLLIEGYTYEEISEFLKSKGHDISRSSIGRYGKEFLNIFRKIKILEDQARTLVSDGGEGMKLLEASEKLFSMELLELMLSSGVDIKKLPSLIGAFAKLQSSGVQRERLKSDLKKKTEKAFNKAEKNLDKMTKEELLKNLREEVYSLV